ncbi:MAG: hypothetical protein WCG47_29440, partial [Dermatophilaceae bacterium]
MTSQPRWGGAACTSPRRWQLISLGEGGAVMSAQPWHLRRHLLPEGFFRPVEYAARTTYRRPPGFYRRLQVIAPVFSALGLTPRYVVRLEVPGRRTGVIRSSFMVLVAYGG